MSDLSTGPEMAKYLVVDPIRECYPDVKNRQSPTMTLLSGRQVPGVAHYVELGWVYDVPEPNPHIMVRTYDNNRVMLFISGDHRAPEQLGATVEFDLAGRTHAIDTATAVFIPKGVPFGNVVWKSVERPHLQMTIEFGTLFSGAVDVDQLVVKKPVYEIWPEEPAKGRMESSMTFLNNNLVPGCNTYIEYSWIYEMPDPNPHIMEHIHDTNEEIVLHIGSDPYAPEDLSAQIEIGLQGQPLLFDKTCALFVPKGFYHGPLIWKKVQRPHIEMAIVLGSGTLAESDPGGHEKAK